MANQLSLGDVMEHLAGSKTLAESDGSLLKRHVTEPATLLQCERLYEEARAKFEALIARLLVDLNSAREPKDSAELRAALELAVERGNAFWRFAGDHLPTAAGTRAIDLGALLKPVAEVVNKLIESAMTTWTEYRKAKELQRETLRAQVQAHRWRAFAEL
jgi:hypothetical protein